MKLAAVSGRRMRAADLMCGQKTTTVHLMTNMDFFRQVWLVVNMHRKAFADQMPHYALAIMTVFEALHQGVRLQTLRMRTLIVCSTIPSRRTKWLSDHHTACRSRSLVVSIFRARKYRRLCLLIQCEYEWVRTYSVKTPTNRLPQFHIDFSKLSS